MLTEAQAEEIEDAGVYSLYIVQENGVEEKVVGNGFVNASKYLPFDLSLIHISILYGYFQAGRLRMMQ